MSEHLLVEWMRRGTGQPDDQVAAAQVEAARLEGWWAELRALEPGAVAEADVVDVVVRIAAIVGAVEARVHAGAGPWARGQRLALKSEAERLVPDALGRSLNFAPEWHPW